jgi:nicotinate-nucleotide pyrophosphorylase (carboxylating)
MGAHYTPKVADGTHVKYWDTVASVSGPARALLTGERVALNLMMRMSGISTHTHSVVKNINSVRIVDTRKTTPLWRRWEREAVLAGGAMNHRFALYDGILIKDNHIAVAGSITEAITKAKSSAHHLLKIEIEVESIPQLEEAINAGADVVMLDNMTNVQLEEAVSFNQGRVLLEASGNMNRERIEAIQDMGIDVISMGGLIHQARWADLSMKIEIL